MRELAELRRRRARSVANVSAITKWAGPIAFDAGADVDSQTVVILGGNPPTDRRKADPSGPQRYRLPGPDQPAERNQLFCRLDPHAAVVLVTGFSTFLVDALDLLGRTLTTGQPLAIVVIDVPRGFRAPARAELDRLSRDLREHLGVLTPRITFPAAGDEWREAGRASTALRDEIGTFGIEALRLRDALLRVGPYLDGLHRPAVEEALNAQALLDRVHALEGCLEKSIREEAGDVGRQLASCQGKAEEFAEAHSGAFTTARYYLRGDPKQVESAFETMVLSWNEVAHAVEAGVRKTLAAVAELAEPLPDEAFAKPDERSAIASTGATGLTRCILERSGDGTVGAMYLQLKSNVAAKVSEDRFELARLVQVLINEFADQAHAVLTAELQEALRPWMKRVVEQAAGRRRELERRGQLVQELASHVQREVDWLREIELTLPGDHLLGEAGQVLDRLVGQLKSRGVTREGRPLPRYDLAYAAPIAAELARLKALLETAPGSIEAELTRLDEVSRALLQRVSAVETALASDTLFGRPASDRRREVETILVTQRRQLKSTLSEVAARHEVDLKRFREEANVFRLVIFGKGKAGKSSLLNFLMGRYVFEEGVNPTTAGRETHDLGALRLVDLPGTHSVHPQHDRVARDHVRLADLIVYATSADKPLDGEDLDELAGLIEQRKRIIVVVTRCDEVNYRRDPPEVRAMRPGDVQAIQSSVRKKLADRFPKSEIPVFLTSVHLAMTGAAAGAAVAQTASGLAPLLAAIVDIIAREGIVLRQVNPLSATLVRVKALRERLMHLAAELAPHTREPRDLRETWRRRQAECIEFCSVRVKRLRTHFDGAKARAPGFLNRTLKLTKALRAAYSAADEIFEHKLRGNAEYQSTYHREMEKRFLDEVILQEKLDRQIADYGAYVEVVVARGLREFFASLTWALRRDAGVSPHLGDVDAGHVKAATETIALAAAKAFLPVVAARVATVVAEMIAARLGVAVIPGVGWVAALLATFCTDWVDGFYRRVIGKTPQEGMLEKLNADLDRLADQLINETASERGPRTLQGIWPETTAVIAEAFETSWSDAVEAPTLIARACHEQVTATLDEVKKIEKSLGDRIYRLRRS